MRQIEKVLWDDFIYYRQFTANITRRRIVGQYTGALKRTDERLTLFADMALWCRDQDFDPRLWLYVLFQTRKWMYPPKLRKGDLMSERLLDRYSAVQNVDFFRQRVDSYNRVQEELCGKGYDPNRDMAPGVEASKARFQLMDKPNGCFELMRSETLGYHPLSKHCRACRLARPCLEKLQTLVPFDILALREGLLTSADAKTIARQAVLFGD